MSKRRKSAKPSRSSGATRRPSTSATRRPSTKRRNPMPTLSQTERKVLDTARRLSKRFHGTPAAVVELSPGERQGGRSRFATVVGELASMSYEPPRGSKRSGSRWVHEIGDRGDGKPTARNRPLLAVDPKSRRPFLIFGRSPLRYSSARGLVG